VVMFRLAMVLVAGLGVCWWLKLAIELGSRVRGVLVGQDGCGTG